MLHMNMTPAWFGLNMHQHLFPLKGDKLRVTQQCCNQAKVTCWYTGFDSIIIITARESEQAEQAAGPVSQRPLILLHLSRNKGRNVSEFSLISCCESDISCREQSRLQTRGLRWREPRVDIRGSAGTVSGYSWVQNQKPDIWLQSYDVMGKKRSRWTSGARMRVSGSEVDHRPTSPQTLSRSTRVLADHSRWHHQNLRWPLESLN